MQAVALKYVGGLALAVLLYFTIQGIVSKTMDWLDAREARAVSAAMQLKDEEAKAGAAISRAEDLERQLEADRKALEQLRSRYSAATGRVTRLERQIAQQQLAGLLSADPVAVESQVNEQTKQLFLDFQSLNAQTRGVQ